MEHDINGILNSLTQGDVDDFSTWLKVGMALHHKGFSCSVWDNWSKGSSKYKEGECQKRWNSFGKNSSVPITFGSLVKMAEDRGYTKNDSFDWDSEIGGSYERKKIQLSPSEELKKYISAIFKDGDIINYVVETYEKDGKYLPSNQGANKTFATLIDACDKNDDISYVIGDWNENAGAFIRINPMDGNGAKNDNVLEYRHCLIESDSLPKEEQLKKIKELNLPCSAIVDSGGKSIHAIVRIDAGTDEKLYRERVSELHKRLEQHGFPVDKACKNPSRLSRIAGVSRNGKRQALLGVNIGASSYEEWSKKSTIPNYKMKPAGYFRNISPKDKSDSILGSRFLCKGNSWIIVAQSGIGKSVLAMQMAMNFTAGRSMFGIAPEKPLKILFIQAENNELDLAEPFHSISGHLSFSEEENARIDSNLIFISESSSSGDKFISLLEDSCERVKPDLVILDPLLSYIGGEINRQEVCSIFLRNKIGPIMEKYELGLIVIHHTGKPPKDVKYSTRGSSLAYLGIGSSELTNWARAVSVLQESKDDNNVYELVNTKRGHRSGAKTITYLKHVQDGICWEETTEPLKPVKTQKGDGNSTKEYKYDYMKFDSMSPRTRIELDNYIAKCLSSHGEPCDTMSVKTVRDSAKKNHIYFNKQTGFWQGRFYVPDSATTGGAQ